MNEYCLDVEEVIELNRRLVKNQYNVLDRTKLEGALATPLQTFDGKYLIDSPLGQTAVLIDHLANAHAFLDGNKRP
ncbi:hypothetical protein CPHO_01320 [Corynebacterium phocae]|uniref:Fido domain-containing protein n=1 Tax=Corynebacterium phocae TaxID=161895 RepID=A0A1L7D0V1_9CORY|nr:Fic family protein [Corynebacterium phocae]APT91779.1 hypothetical protein CPHO_01320 [Corynebacterium phocae]KAA8728480.1 Fic family protein [Corynebacterium phocae]